VITVALPGGEEVVVFSIRTATSPLVFVKPGTYDGGGGKQKTAFSVGTVYFRHGAKSEPGNTEDLEQFVERRLEQIRKSWLDGIAKVVEAPAGSSVQILRPGTSGDPQAVRLTNDPGAQVAYSISVDKTHPFRQKEVVREVNSGLNGKRVISSFHIQCIRRVHRIDDDPTFCYTQKFASPKFSQAFVDWVLQKYSANPAFFEEAKNRADELRRSRSGPAE
jgi:hypothetical protein